MTAKYRYIVGVDEVGRGPLAGPVAIGAVVIPSNSIRVVSKAFSLKDSKQLTPLLREKTVQTLKKMKQDGVLNFTVAYTSASLIDAKGITWAIQNALQRALGNLKVKPLSSLILLDGGLKAPSEFIHQKTIIKGDEKEIAIALASIVAKVSRDRRMDSLALKYPLYGFEKHKGYGTLIHRNAIKRYGLSPIHRNGFCRKLTGYR